jgi:TonB family protein
MADIKRVCLTHIVTPALFAVACSTAKPAETPSDVAETDGSAVPTQAPEAEMEPATSPTADAPALLEPSVDAPAPLSGGARDTRSKEDIQRVIAGNRQKIRDCYDAALANNPGIQGDLVISFVINPDGSVKDVEVNTESDLHIPELDTCATGAVRALEFPASSRGLESKVNYPFNFKPPPPGKPASKP